MCRAIWQMTLCQQTARNNRCDDFIFDCRFFDSRPDVFIAWKSIQLLEGVVPIMLAWNTTLDFTLYTLLSSIGVHRSLTLYCMTAIKVYNRFWCSDIYFYGDSRLHKPCSFGFFVVIHAMSSFLKLKPYYQQKNKKNRTMIDGS